MADHGIGTTSIGPRNSWSARCGESRTAGVGSGPGKRSGQYAGTAPRADFHDLQLEDPGFHYRVLSDFRDRPAEDGRADKLFTA